MKQERLLERKVIKKLYNQIEELYEIIYEDCDLEYERNYIYMMKDKLVNELSILFKYEILSFESVNSLHVELSNLIADLEETINEK